MKANRNGNGRLVWQRGLGVFFGAVVGTLVVLLILPLTQTIGRPPAKDLMVRSADIADVPPPPPPPEQEEEKKEEEPPPQLEQESQPLDLEQLELALNPGFGDSLTGDFALKLAQAVSTDDLDRIFSLSDLDQKPRVIFQTPPVYPPELRSRGVQGTVYVTFVVDRHGRVVNPSIEKSTDPRFERPALDAVKQWRFEPGMRNGQEVQFKMRVPITFSLS